MKNTLIALLAVMLFGCANDPFTPPAAVVQSQDLLDADADGVINARDKCADTPHSAVVDNNGCPAYVDHPEEHAVRVLFANDSSVIPATFRAEIKQMSDFLKRYPNTHIELKGHASPVGKHDYNQQLSVKRAQAVKQLLIANGIAPSRIKTLGFGDSDPVTAPDNAQRDTLSRRVVARVAGHQDAVVEAWTIYMVRGN